MVLEQLEKIPISDELFATALRYRVCPVCLILQTKTNDLLCGLQSGAVHDQEIKTLVLSAGGYCHFHFWYLEKLASPAANAHLLENLLKNIENQFLADTSGDAASSFGEGWRCPVCSCCENWQEKLLAGFADKVGTQDFRVAYENSHGLCLPHLALVLKRLPDSGQRAFLVESSRRQIAALRRELGLLITKWQNKNHRLGGEKDSPHRGVAKIVGGKYCTVSQALR
ncbi:MAG TPA: DUF6062 family protein [Candidatus Acidoferrales bacterium]|nr:DUF6062 family protein [Candidatus Acidoferrales bacterium]